MRSELSERTRHQRRSGAGALLLALLAGLLAAACQPESVTGARDRLSGDDPRTVTYRLPLAQEEYGATSFLEGVRTRILDGGLIAVPVLPDTIRAIVGGALRADGRADLEAVETLDPGALDLGELADVVAASDVRTAPIELSLSHTSAAALRLVDPELALVRTDASGRPVRDASGDPVVETDSAGRRLAVPVGDTVRLPPGERVELEPDGALLVDGLAERLVGGDPAAVGLLGSVEVPAGQRALVESDDALSLAHRALVGLDLVLPDSGVVVERHEVGEGLGFSEEDARQVEDRIVSAGGSVVARNPVPFRVRVDLAYVGGDRRGEEIFGADDRVVLDSLEVGGDPGTGSVSVDTVAMAVTGGELGPLLRDAFTAAVRIRLLPARGTIGRGALRADELVDLDARVYVEVRSGEGAGSGGGP